MQSRPPLSIGPSPSNARNVRDFLKEDDLRPRILHEVIYKIIALENKNRNSSEDIIGVLKEYLQTTRGINPQYLGIQVIKVMMMQDFTAQHFFKRKDKTEDDDIVALAIQSMLTILEMDAAHLLTQHTHQDRDHKAIKTIKISPKRKTILSDKQKLGIPHISTSYTLNLQMPASGITAAMNTIAFLNDAEKRQLEMEIGREASRTGMSPVTLFEFLEELPLDLAINDDIPFEIKRTAFLTFVDTEIKNNNKQILNYLFYHSIMNVSYNALELIMEMLVTANKLAMVIDDHKLYLSKDLLTDKFGPGAATILMRKVENLIASKAPQAPQASKAPQVSAPVFTAVPRPLFFCKYIEKTINQFTSDIAFLDELEKNKLKYEIGAVAKKEGISVDKMIALLKAQSQEPLFIGDKCKAGEADEIKSKYEGVIDEYLNNNNTQILTYLFYNSVMNNNTHTVKLVFHKLHQKGWDLKNNDKFDVAMDLLYANHGAQAGTEMEIGIKDMLSHAGISISCRTA